MHYAVIIVEPYVVYCISVPVGYLHQGGYDLAGVCLSVSVIGLSVSRKVVDEFR